MKRNGYARPFPSALTSAPAWSVRTDPGSGGFSVRRYARRRSTAETNATRGYTGPSGACSSGDRARASGARGRRFDSCQAHSPLRYADRPRTTEARVEFTSSEVRRVGVILFVAAFATGGAGAYWIAAARKRRRRRRWHVSGIRVWGARTF